MSGDGYQGGNGGWGGSGNGTWGGGANDTWGGDGGGGGGGGWGGPSAQDIGYAMMVMSKMGGGKGEMMMNMMSGGCGKGGKDSKGGKGGKDGGKDGGKGCGKDGGKGKGKSGKSKNVQQFPKKVKTGRNFFSWKGEVCTAFSRDHKVPPTKENIIYTTLALDGGLFMSTITCDKFSTEYSSEEAFDSKRLAEEACALAALMSEYPAHYASIPDDTKEKGAQAGAGKEDLARMAADGEEAVQPRDADVQYMKERKAGGFPGQFSTKQPGNAQQPKRVKTGRNYFSWKSEVCTAYSREHKASPTKESIVYTTLALDGGLFMSTVTSDKFSVEYSSEEAFDSGRLAEEACAMAALMGEYPAAYAAIPDTMKEKGAMAGAGKEDSARMEVEGEELVQPKKRKAGGGLGQPTTKQFGNAQQPKRVKTGRNFFSWKGEICNAYSRHHKVPPTKQSISYTTVELDGGLFMSTLKCDKFPTEYSSEEACDSKRLAEETCALAALMGEYPAAYAAFPDSTKEKGAMAGAGKEDAASMGAP